MYVPSSNTKFVIIINPATKYRKPSSSLVGIGRHNKLNSKKDTGQAGMTELGYLLVGLIAGNERTLYGNIHVW
jgi:hypothetical protein